MNKFQIIISVVTVILLLLISRGQSFASEIASKSSASLQSPFNKVEPDNRTQVLEGFLNQYDSPLAPYASDFIKNADKYNLDWRLVASIAGLESTFGKHIPYESYNGWGWGIYGDNIIRFNSWSEGIETISKGLRERYLRDIEYSDPYIIGPTYAASPTWAQRVSFFMEKMEEYRLQNGKSTLTLTI